MSYLLSEIFGESSTYMMGIAFETISYDQEKNSNVKRKGWEIPYLEADINDCAIKNRNNDCKWFEGKDD